MLVAIKKSSNQIFSLIQFLSKTMTQTKSLQEFKQENTSTTSLLQSKPQFLEIHGAGFQNKGAELMLRTVISEFKSRLPEFVPVIDPTLGEYESRCELGARQTFPLRASVGSQGFSKRFMRQKLFESLKIEQLIRYVGGIQLSTYGCESLSRIQAMIDISGFAYTDQWGTQMTIDFATLTDYYKSRKIPVILLPQAFGPFHAEESKEAFRRIVDNASLIFARDRISYQYVMELCPNSEKVRQAPDITLFHPNFSKDITEPNSNYVGLVPNIRMLDLGKDQWGNKYESYLIEIAKKIIECGLKVKIIVHETNGQDFQIAQKVAKTINSTEISIINESNPIVLKKIIGDSLMIVGSRYHSLVSCFSKNVPAVGLGWSHKYETLFEDFGCEDFIISHDTPIKNALKLIQKLIVKDTNLQYRQIINQKLQKMSQDNRKMWEMVIKIVEQKSLS
ncbi:MAG: hypothetical protein Tsb0014_20210 [Pleurocapsa sp.]